MAVLVAFGFVRGYRALSDLRKAMLARLSKVFTLRCKLKILIGFYMIATKISSVYEVRLPEEVGLLLDHSYSTRSSVERGWYRCHTCDAHQHPLQATPEVQSLEESHNHHYNNELRPSSAWHRNHRYHTYTRKQRSWSGTWSC